mgnify:FL=1
MHLARKQLGNDFDLDTHLTPRYNPWDQRMCLVPDGDLFMAIRDGKASVVTDMIDRFDENGIHVQSGEFLKADIIVSATGIEINALNDINVTVDQIQVEPHKKFSYKGMK